ncbi:MAG TPA: hypothetical protein VIV11_12855 [Kofleriaceae bacterium]
MSSKQLATDIEYDNSGTGLVSTNVQDAIDDVVSMAQAQEERMASSVIVCKFATASFNMPANYTVYPHAFTSSECGGRMPDASYIGALASYATCSYEIQGIQVMNAGEADGPGVVIRKQWLTSSFSCSGPAHVTALYHKAH